MSTNAAYSFGATANRTLVAHFAIDTFTIVVTADPAEGGSVSGGGVYSYGQTVELSATANAGLPLRELDRGRERGEHRRHLLLHRHRQPDAGGPLRHRHLHHQCDR